jgi:hypothetical protein
MEPHTSQEQDMVVLQLRYHTHLIITAYDRPWIETILRDWNAQQLLQRVHAGDFAEDLSDDELAELTDILVEWQRRALSTVTLRDAIQVDQRRGTRLHDLLCQAGVIGQIRLLDSSAPLVKLCSARNGVTWLEPTELRRAFALHKRVTDPTTNVRIPAGLAALMRQADDGKLGLLCSAEPGPPFPLPHNIDTLLPPPPAAYDEPPLLFEQPTGWRRKLAIGLALSGVAALTLPLLAGELPTRPAGLPLGLFTLALLVGIRAGWPGYLGALVLWLVPNLPGFQYGTTPALFWPTLPLSVIGLILLACDRYVWALWRWIWQRRGL